MSIANGQCDDATAKAVAAMIRVSHDAKDKPPTPVVIHRISIVRDEPKHSNN
jgi:hypothetical protein